MSLCNDGRYLHLCCRKGRVSIRSVAFRTVGYPVTRQDAFSCSDPLLNRIYAAGLESIRLIMQNDFEDCLRREQGLHNWRNVTHAFISSFYAFGDDRLIRKMIRDALYTQNDRGWISGSGPSDDTNDEISKAMWLIECVSLYYTYTGNERFTREVYEPLRCLMRYLGRMENKQLLIDGRNEISNLRGRSVWIDDHTADRYDDPDLIMFSFNTLYYGTLLNMAQISASVGEARDAEFYRSKAAALRASINRALWDKRSKMYVDWVKNDQNSGTIQDAFLILALYYRLPDPAQCRLVSDHLLNLQSGTMREPQAYRFTLGYYYFVLHVLFSLDKAEQAYRLMREYFGSWLSLGFTAFGEHFMLPEAKGKSTLGREINVHTNGSAAQPFFFTHILGIQPELPGFAAVRVAPIPGDLTWARGRVYTPHGTVEVSWRVREDMFDLLVRLPDGLPCRTVLPEGLRTGTIQIERI